MIAASMESKKQISFRVVASANDALAALAERYEMDYRDVYAAAFLALAAFAPDVQRSILETYLLTKMQIKGEDRGEMVAEFRRVWGETQAARHGKRDLAGLVAEAIRSVKNEGKDRQQGQG